MVVVPLLLGGWCCGSGTAAKELKFRLNGAREEGPLADEGDEGARPTPNVAPEDEAGVVGWKVTGVIRRGEVRRRVRCDDEAVSSERGTLDDDVGWWLWAAAGAGCG
jgi:hypothetical protein